MDEAADTRAAWDEARGFMQRWRIVVSDGGEIWIRPRVSSVRLVEIACLMRRIRSVCDEGFPRRIVFDLDDAHWIGASPALVRRLISHFARSINAPCRVVDRSTP